MRNCTIIACLILLAIAGCVRSLHPLYTERDLVFDERLLGSWTKNGDSTNTWIFQKAGENAYELLETEKGAPARFEAHLVKLGGHLFLDIAPGEMDTKNDFFKFHHIPVHTFSRIWLENKRFRLAMLDNDWLRDMIDNRKVEIRHERQEKAIILTAPTADLQKLVIAYAEDEEAFPKPGEFTRKR